jgi:hypothetical protein
MGPRAMTFVTAPSVFNAIGNLKREIASWPDVTESAINLADANSILRRNELGLIHLNRGSSRVIGGAGRG